MMKEMQDLYQQIFVQNKVKESSNARVHNTRSKKEKCCPYIIPSVLIEIEQQFSKIANEFIDDFGVFTQTDSEIDDIEMEEENKENKSKKKKKKPKKRQTRVTRGRGRGKRKDIESETDDDDEMEVVYAESSDDDDEESDSDC